jgi:hypothetical protein
VDHVLILLAGSLHADRRASVAHVAPQLGDAAIRHARIDWFASSISK